LVNRAKVLTLCEQLRALEPAPTAAPGRKPGGQTRYQEILDAIGKMLTNGEIEFDRGGKTRAAKQLAMTFPDYAYDTIRRMITLEIESRRRKSG
jgi:hypothetical protein